jgi:hypothetical protein
MVRAIQVDGMPWLDMLSIESNPLLGVYTKIQKLS